MLRSQGHRTTRRRRGQKVSSYQKKTTPTPAPRGGGYGIAPIDPRSAYSTSLHKNKPSVSEEQAGEARPGLRVSLPHRELGPEPPRSHAHKAAASLGPFVSPPPWTQQGGEGRAWGGWGEVRSFFRCPRNPSPAFVCLSPGRLPAPPPPGRGGLRPQKRPPRPAPWLPPGAERAAARRGAGPPATSPPRRRGRGFKRPPRLGPVC